MDIPSSPANLSSNEPLLCRFKRTYYTIISILYNISSILFVKPFELIAVQDLTSKNASPDDEAPLSLILCLPAGYSCASISGTMTCGELRADVCEDEI
eukprot:scaffold9097_cov38-Cyclotella_meneghiniana.AAC.3